MTPSSQPMRQVLTRIARDELLPGLDGYAIADPSPFEESRPAVLIYRKPIGDVFVGLHLAGVNESEFFAHYVQKALFAPTDRATFMSVGMLRDGFLRRFFRDRRWFIDGKRDAATIKTLKEYVELEGIPVLNRWSVARSFADDLVDDEHELESDPIGTEQAAYAYLLAGDDGRAGELLEILAGAQGRGWPGEAELSADEMTVLQDRARLMLQLMSDDRQAAVRQLNLWRRVRLAELALRDARVA